MQLIINEKVAGAEKQATKAEKQMQKAEKNSYHRNWETNMESRKTAIIGAGKQMQKTEKNGYHRNWETNAENRKKQLPWELGNKYGEQKKQLS